MKKKNVTNLGLKRLKKGTAEAYLKRAKDIERMLLAGEFKGSKVKPAKKMYQFCMWKFRSLSGANKRGAEKLAQMIFPEILRSMGVTPIDDLFIRRAVAASVKLAKKKQAKRKVA